MLPATLPALDLSAAATLTLPTADPAPATPRSAAVSPGLPGSAAPIFVDPTGRRRLGVRLVVAVLTVGALAFVGVFGAVLAGNPVTPAEPTNAPAQVAP